MLGLFITDNGRFKLEELVVHDRTDEAIIQLELSLVAVAWDNNDMHAPLNLKGAQYN